MKFKSVTIKNFRNFEDISIELTNKNVLFGMNDVGKTNFLYALRFVFDKDIRKQNFNDTDYFKKKVEFPIEITIEIDISDIENTDSQKLRAKLKGALLSNQNTVYIKVKASYDEKEMVGIPVMYWGGELEDLEEMKVRGTYYEIDYVFNVTYIDAYVDLYTLFKKNANKLLVNDKEEDKDVLENINNICTSLNDEISNLSGIKAFEEKIELKYKKYGHDNSSISVKSEIAVKGLYSNVVPYIKQDDDESLYPTSGEGRKKLLVYSIFDLLSQDEEDKKINIFLIEEPENHLHRSMQIALSHTLFVDDKYQYLFMTTHSPHVLSEMDKVNLIRLYNENKTVSSSSALYVVPNKFKSQRKMLNRGLVEAIFADKVLLVEGPSENVLFGKILSVINPFYEADGIYILPVGGFGFRPYFDMLKALRIKIIIKTDNDLRKIKGKEKYSVLGFLRLNNYLDRKILSEEPIDENSVEAKRKLYADNQEELDEIRNQYSLYLSRCSLEEDLDEVIHNQMVIYLTEANNDPIGYLQEKKNYHMVELVEKLTDDDCRCIYNHYNFACLREVMK